MVHLNPLAIPVTAILMPVLLVATILTLKHRQRRREMEHLERLAAIENGLPTSAGEACTFWLAVTAIGFGVPLLAIAAAFFTSIAASYKDAPELAWIAATIVSLASLGCASGLGFLQLKRLDRAQSQALNQARKPAYDPDEFDVVSSRG